MNVAVLGLWHLGCVTAACLADAGHTVTGFDPDATNVTAISGGIAPVSEPGLPELLARGLATRTLRVTADLADAVREADIVWITDRLEWMSVESAEMTKHAVNAFLATSVVFINELAGICERAGADAKEVERGLKTEQRIGPRAYVSPGAAFAGGTLARDLRFLCALGEQLDTPTPLFAGVLSGNAAHGMWAGRRLRTELGPLEGVHVTVWGLTYTTNTSTLRRSGAIALCRSLVNEGARVHVHDPAADTLPADLDVTRHSDPIDAATTAAALVIATPWPAYRDVDLDRLAAAAPHLIVLDAARHLAPTIGRDPRFRLIAVGQGQA